MDNLETSLTTTADKAHGNAVRAIVERFIKPRASTIFGHPVYFMDGPGALIVISGPHEEFFNSSFGIWISTKKFHIDAADKSGWNKCGGT